MTLFGDVRLWAATLAAVSLASCGGDKAPQAALTQPPPVVVTVTVTPDPPETTDPVETEDPVETDFEDEEPVSESPSGPVVLGTNASGRELKLADVFSTKRDWEESRYDVASRRDIQGMGVSLNSCGDYYAAQLELRLARNFTTLTMNVGQANNSPSSDETLVVEIVANGRQQDFRRVPFDRIQSFKVSVRDVNALKLRFWIDEEECNGGQIVAVVEKLTVS